MGVFGRKPCEALNSSQSFAKCGTQEHVYSCIIYHLRAGSDIYSRGFDLVGIFTAKLLWIIAKFWVICDPSYAK